MTTSKNCVACRHAIDETARLCPYCGADPETGRKFDPGPILKTHFPGQKDISGPERVLAFLRERQGIVVSGLVVVAFLLLTAAHQMATRRNASDESNVPPVPLTEVAGMDGEADRPELPIPEPDFTWVGRPETMNVMLIEPGAVAPPPDMTPPPPARTATPAPQRAAARTSAPAPTTDARAARPVPEAPAGTGSTTIPAEQPPG